MAEQPFAQSLQIGLPVLVVEKARQAIVAALHDVLMNTRKVEASKSAIRLTSAVTSARQHHPTPRQSMESSGVAVRK